MTNCHLIKNSREKAGQSLFITKTFRVLLLRCFPEIVTDIFIKNNTVVLFQTKSRFYDTIYEHFIFMVLEASSISAPKSRKIVTIKRKTNSLNSFKK